MDKQTLVHLYSEYHSAIKRNKYTKQLERIQNIMLGERGYILYNFNSTFKKLRSWDPVPSLHGK